MKSHDPTRSLHVRGFRVDIGLCAVTLADDAAAEACRRPAVRSTRRDAKRPVVLTVDRRSDASVAARKPVKTTVRTPLRNASTWRASAATAVGSLFGVGGIGCWLAVRYPMSPHLAIRLSEVFGTVSLVVALLMICLRRRVTAVMLNIILALGTVMLSVLIARTGSAAGVVLPGAYYMCGALTAAYFFPPSQARVHAWLAASGFTAGVLASGVPNLVVPWFMITAALLGSAEMLRHLVAQLHQQAAVDPLTGLANRAYFRLAAERQLALAGRGEAPFTVAILDLDDFKAVNDNRGHDAGDALLTEIAAAWHSQLRRTDLLARYGGDEFALIMPFTDDEGARRLLDRLGAAHDARWSAGVATWDGAADLSQLMRRADLDLYRAKSDRAHQSATTTRAIAPSFAEQKSVVMGAERPLASDAS